jgi:hypothetical protein
MPAREKTGATVRCPVVAELRSTNLSLCVISGSENILRLSAIFIND